MIDRVLVPMEGSEKIIAYAEDYDAVVIGSHGSDLRSTLPVTVVR